jgi:RNA polymerase sigma-70 factor (ECF subfamily)
MVVPPEPKGSSTASRLITQAAGGDRSASEQLMSLVYPEMRALAGAIMRGQRPGHTLQATALVHEVWMKLVGNMDRIEGRAHFFAVAATAMRQVLADHARSAGRQKRGGGARRITLHDIADGEHEIDLIDFHDCLERLATLNSRHARIVELRVLGTLTVDEIAEEMGVSRRTVQSDWRVARAWLWNALFIE